jgi:hypothetical protein
MWMQERYQIVAATRFPFTLNKVNEVFWEHFGPPPTVAKEHYQTVITKHNNAQPLGMSGFYEELFVRERRERKNGRFSFEYWARTVTIWPPPKETPEQLATA